MQNLGGKQSVLWELENSQFIDFPLQAWAKSSLSTHLVNRKALGAFHLTQKSGHFGWFIKWNRPFRFGPTGIFGTSFEGGPQ